MYQLILAAGLLSACSPKEAPRVAEPEAAARAAPESWLHGTVDERFDRVAAHLRGFDMAMVEVGYRYTELYWAGQDRNWGYAAYQLGKVETAVARGIERRPARAASARMLEGAVTTVRGAIERQDGDAMDAALLSFTATCNACHGAEQMPFITVTPPAVRASPVAFSATGTGADTSSESSERQRLNN